MALSVQDGRRSRIGEALHWTKGCEGNAKTAILQRIAALPSVPKWLLGLGIAQGTEFLHCLLEWRKTFIIAYWIE